MKKEQRTRLFKNLNYYSNHIRSNPDKTYLQKN